MVSTKFLLANLALTTAVLGAVCPGVPPVNAVGTAASVNVAAALPTSTKHNPYRPRPSTKSQPNTNARPNTKAASAAAKPTSKASAKPTSVNPTSVKPTTKASVKPTTAAAAKPTSTAKASTAAAPAPSAAAAGSLASNPINKVELGAKWEICIHAPIKHDSVDDIIPKDAKILDIDMVHAQEFPNMIPMIKVHIFIPFNFTPANNLLESWKGCHLLLQCWCCPGLGRRQGCLPGFRHWNLPWRPIHW